MSQTTSRITRSAKSGRQRISAPGAGRSPKGAVVATAELKLLVIEPEAGVKEYVRMYSGATPMQIVEIEKAGVRARLLKELSKEMAIPSSRMFEILGVPKATAEKKAAANEIVTGRGGHAAIGMVKLLGIAKEMVESSTANEAKGFDSAKWLGGWIERPQPSLGGRKPADLLDTPTGVDVVARLLGSIASGAYQ